MHKYIYVYITNLEDLSFPIRSTITIHGFPIYVD